MAGKKDSLIDPATRRRNPVIRPALMCRPEVAGLNMIKIATLRSQ